VETTVCCAAAAGTSTAPLAALRLGATGFFRNVTVTWVSAPPCRRRPEDLDVVTICCLAVLQFAVAASLSFAGAGPQARLPRRSRSRRANFARFGHVWSVSCRPMIAGVLARASVLIGGRGPEARAVCCAAVAGTMTTTTVALRTGTTSILRTVTLTRVSAPPCRRRPEHPFVRGRLPQTASAQSRRRKV
jgi:hypothetical protein